MTEEHVTDIRRKVKDLRKLERVLTDLAAKCSGDAVPDCPVLDALSESITKFVAGKPRLAG